MNGDGRKSNRAIWILVALATVAALAWAREILVPVALGGLFAFLLAPLAGFLERRRFPRGLAAGIPVLLLVACAGGMACVVIDEAVDLSKKLPTYRDTIRAKLQGLDGGGLAQPVREAFDSLDRLGDEVLPKPPEPPRPAAEPDAAKPVAVEVVEPQKSTIESALPWVGALLERLVQILVVLVLTGFLIAYREDVRDRVIRLASTERIVPTTQALDEASRRVSRYLGVMVLLNTGYASVLALGLWLLGVPNAPLWAVLAGLLRFIPYIGSTLGAILPLTFAFAAFDGWGRTSAVVVLVIGVDFLVGSIVEPLVMGRRTGLPPIAVLLAAIVWTWLWGIAGLFLSVPLTLCLSVMGRHIPPLRGFAVFLEPGPSLERWQRVYQRLLALDVSGARRAVDEEAREAPVVDVLDRVLLPALRQATEDHRAGVLPEEAFRSLATAVGDLAEDLGGREEEPAVPQGPVRVLCVPAGDDEDRIGCDFLRRALAERGIAADVSSSVALGAEVAEQVEKGAYPVVCIGALPPFAHARVRYLLKRVRARAPDTHLVAAIWDPSAGSDREHARLEAAGANATTSGLAQTADEVLRQLSWRPVAEGAPTA